MKHILNLHRVLPFFIGFSSFFLMTTTGCAPRFGCNYTNSTKPRVPEVMTTQQPTAVEIECLIGL